MYTYNTKTMPTVDFKKLISQAYLEPSHTCKIDSFATIVDIWFRF